MPTLVISYARTDQALVRGIVKLLRAAYGDTVGDAVYWDEDFEPGAPWFDQIQRSIDDAPRVFVFWCAHSAKSTQVSRELAYALSVGKAVVPVLLDDTSLTEALSPIHGVDLRATVIHGVPIPSPTPPPKRRLMSPLWAALGLLPLALAIAVGKSSWPDLARVLRLQQTDSVAPANGPGVAIPFPVLIAAAGALIVFLGLGAAALAWSLSRRPTLSSDGREAEDADVWDRILDDAIVQRFRPYLES